MCSYIYIYIYVYIYIYDNTQCNEQIGEPISNLTIFTSPAKDVAYSTSSGAFLPLVFFGGVEGSMPPWEAACGERG